MRYQRLELDQALRYKPNRSWISVVVAILEPEVDLIGRQVHEWDVLKVFPNPYHED